MKKKHRKRIKENHRLLKMIEPSSPKKQKVWMCTDIGTYLSYFETWISWTDEEGKYHHETLVKRKGLTKGWFNRDEVNREMNVKKEILEEKYNISIKGYVSIGDFNGLCYGDKDLPQIKEEAKRKNVTLLK